MNMNAPKPDDNTIDPLAKLVSDMEAELDEKLNNEGGDKPKPAPFSFTPAAAPLSERLRATQPAPAPTAAFPPPPAARTAEAAEPAPAAAASRAVAQKAGSEAESFLANGARLLDKQRRKILEMESQNEFARVKLIDDYRVKLRDLEHEASEALRDFDEQFEHDLADAKRILDALAKMRG